MIVRAISKWDQKCIAHLNSTYWEAGFLHNDITVSLQVSWDLRWGKKGKKSQRERVGEAAYLLSHPGQSALASGSQAASLGGHSHSSWLRPDGRRHRTRPGSALRLYRSLTAPLKHTLDSESAFRIKHNGHSVFILSSVLTDELHVHYQCCYKLVILGATSPTQKHVATTKVEALSYTNQPDGRQPVVDRQ